jgi:hypothetical protein
LAVHSEITPTEAADRLALRELFDAYAHCADRRDAEGQNGQSTVAIDGNRATGESYTIAHHVFTDDGDRKIMVASLRYLDTFSKLDGRWYFAERKLILDWSETRSISAPAAV